MVCCFIDEEIWMCGNDNIIWFYNFKGELLRDILIYLGNMLIDIVIIKRNGNRYLVYIDCFYGIVNIMKSV